MTPRLPIPGQDSGDWGDILNEYLRVVHDEQGQLKNGAVRAPQLGHGSVSGVALANGSVGTAKIVDGSVTDGKLAAGAVTDDKLATGLRERIETLESVTGGRSIEIRASSTHIQWKYVDESVWTDLVALSELKGDAGERGPEGPTGTTDYNLLENKPELKTVATSGSFDDLIDKPSYTKSEVGLESVDNTSDADKPVSTATQTALNSKADTAHTHAIDDLSTSNTDTTQVLTPDGSGGIGWAATPSRGFSVPLASNLYTYAASAVATGGWAFVSARQTMAVGAADQMRAFPWAIESDCLIKTVYVSCRVSP